MPSRGNLGSSKRLICGINAVKLVVPHGKIRKVFISDKSANKKEIKEIIKHCESKKIIVEILSEEEIDRLALLRRHQGICAQSAPPPMLNDLQFLELVKNASKNSTVLLLDSITDPHNLGAIMRTAEATGAIAVVTEKRRSAPVSDAVVQASTGASEILPIYRCSNLKHAIDMLKENGFWIFGASEKAEKDIWSANMKGKAGIVLGSEGFGLRDIIQKKCDNLIRVPMRGKTSSLNVSVAASVILYEKSRQEQENKSNADN